MTMPNDDSVIPIKVLLRAYDTPDMTRPSMITSGTWSSYRGRATNEGVVPPDTTSSHGSDTYLMTERGASELFR